MADNITVKPENVHPDYHKGDIFGVCACGAMILPRFDGFLKSVPDDRGQKYIRKMAFVCRKCKEGVLEEKLRLFQGMDHPAPEAKEEPKSFVSKFLTYLGW